MQLFKSILTIYFHAKTLHSLNIIVNDTHTIIINTVKLM